MSTAPLRPSYAEEGRRMSEESREFLNEYGGFSGSVSVSKMVAVSCLVLALLGKLCVGLGIALLLFTRGMEFPLTSASGIWTGVLVVATGYLGMLVYWKTAFSGSLDMQLAGRRLVGVHYGLVLIALSLGVLHLVYTFWGLEVCTKEEGACYKDDLREDVKSLELGCLIVSVFVICLLLFVTIVIGHWMKRSAARRRGGGIYDSL